MMKKYILVVCFLLTVVSFSLFGETSNEIKNNDGNFNGKKISSLWSGYFKIESFLAKDDITGAKKSAQQLKESTRNLDKSLQERINSELTSIENSNNLNEARVNFYKLTDLFGHENIKKLSTENVYEFFCPMALDEKGAKWFQDTKGVSNPYLGKEMLSCGELQNIYKAK